MNDPRRAANTMMQMPPNKMLLLLLVLLPIGRNLLHGRPLVGNASVGRGIAIGSEHDRAV
jgi:type IV secretory pathway TrbL component